MEADQLVAGMMFGDDHNTHRHRRVGRDRDPGSVSIAKGGARLEPFVALNNLFGKKYVGSANINGAFGRVLEPAPGRNGYVGMEVGWAKR